jgi:hypothetical protein
MDQMSVALLRHRMLSRRFGEDYREAEAKARDPRGSRVRNALAVQ